MTTSVSRAHSATFRKLCNWLSIAVISAAALSWQGCRSSSETTRTHRQTSQATRIRDQMTFGAATLQQEVEQWRTTQPDIASVSLVLTDSMLLSLPPRANYQAGEGTPLQVSATRTGEGLRIEATTYGLGEQRGARFRVVAADTLAASTYDSSEIATNDTAAVSERRERRARPPAGWGLAATIGFLTGMAFLGAVAAKLGRGGDG